MFKYEPLQLLKFVLGQPRTSYPKLYVYGFDDLNEVVRNKVSPNIGDNVRLILLGITIDAMSN